MYTAVIHTLRAQCFWKESRRRWQTAWETVWHKQSRSGTSRHRDRRWPTFPTMRKLKFVCVRVCLCVCTRVGANKRCEHTIFWGRCCVWKNENLVPGRMGVFNISKVSSRDIQRHKRVMGDADGSVNSAGGWARDVITRCSRWQQWWSCSVPNVLYLPNNTAGDRGLGAMKKNPPITSTGEDVKTCPIYPAGHVTHEGQKDKKKKKERKKERNKERKKETKKERLLFGLALSCSHYVKVSLANWWLRFTLHRFCAALGETSSTGRCAAQLTTLCHLYNWHLHVREWQRHQSVPCFLGK